MNFSHRWILASFVLIAAGGVAAAERLEQAPGGGWLTYVAPPGPATNQLTLRRSGASILLLDTATRAVLLSRPLAGAEGVSIQGQPGSVDDTLTVDLGGGPLALPQGIHFDGGAGGYDTLAITGGDPAPASYTATGPQAGIVTHGSTRIIFSNLEPITDESSSPNLTINATAGADTISIVNGGIGCSGACTLTKVSSPSFESISFANKTNVTVSGGGGADTFNLNNSSPATGLSKLVLDAGGNPGDSIAVAAFKLPAGTLLLTDVVTVTQSGGITAAGLAVHASGPVNLSDFNNQVTTVAGGTTGAGAGFAFASSAPTLTVGSVAGLAGISTARGQILVQDYTSGATLLVNSPMATAGGKLLLYNDHMTFNAALNAFTGTVWLDNQNVAEPLSLGTKTPTTLGLLQSDLNQITAGTLQIGDFDTDTGGLTITANIAAPAGWSTLDLQQQAVIDELFSAALTVPQLALRSHGGDVSLGFGTNHVSVLAGATTGGRFAYVDKGATTLGTVGAVSGLSTAGGAASVGADKGGITITQPVFAGAGNIDLGAQESTSPVDNVTIAPGVVVSSTTGAIVLEAGDQVNLEAGSTVATGVGGSVLDAFSVDDTDNIGGGLIAGTLASPSNVPQASGGGADETLVVDFHAGANLPNELLYDGGNGLNGVTVTDAGDSSPHLYEGGGTGVSRDFTNLIHFSRVQNLTMIGGSGADQFGLLPDASVTMHAVGGLPGTAPGDQLFVNSLTAAHPLLSITSFDATGAAGQWTFSNRQPVTFTGIDTFQNLNHQLYLPALRK
jgi:hypothetical protein